MHQAVPPLALGPGSTATSIHPQQNKIHPSPPLPHSSSSSGTDSSTSVTGKDGLLTVEVVAGEARLAAGHVAANDEVGAACGGKGGRQGEERREAEAKRGRVEGYAWCMVQRAHLGGGVPLEMLLR